MPTPEQAERYHLWQHLKNWHAVVSRSSVTLEELRHIHGERHEVMKGENVVHMNEHHRIQGRIDFFRSLEEDVAYEDQHP